MLLYSHMISTAAAPALTDPLEPVWRALSDPTRRAILDRLRQRPATTGVLAAAFPLSRYAVMKHLDVLVRAGLVVVRRQGRERWNHLNAVPLQQMYERWVRTYEAVWAAPLVRLKDALEQSRSTTEVTVMPDTPTLAATIPRPAGVIQVELAIPIAAPIDRVWRALTTQVELWWPRDFFASANPAVMRFDATLGGRLYEDDGNGGGVTWYTVIAMAPGESIDMAGHLTPAYGGPAQTILRLALRRDGDATILDLTDGVFGNVGERTAAGNEAGWRALFEVGFKGFVEGDRD